MWDGDFWSAIDDVVRFVGNEPAFVFVDPYGLKDLKFHRLVDLCERLNRVDLMVNFASPAATRLRKERRQIIDEAVGDQVGSCLLSPRRFASGSETRAVSFYPRFSR